MANKPNKTKKTNTPNKPTKPNNPKQTKPTSKQTNKIKQNNPKQKQNNPKQKQAQKHHQKRQDPWGSEDPFSHVSNSDKTSQPWCPQRRALRMIPTTFGRNALPKYGGKNASMWKRILGRNFESMARGYEYVKLRTIHPVFANYDWSSSGRSWRKSTLCSDPLLSSRTNYIVAQNVGQFGNCSEKCCPMGCSAFVLFGCLLYVNVIFCECCRLCRLWYTLFFPPPPLHWVRLRALAVGSSPRSVACGGANPAELESKHVSENFLETCHENWFTQLNLFLFWKYWLGAAISFLPR